MLNYIVKNYKWGPSWWRKDRKGNKKCLQGLKLKSLLMKVKEESEKAGIKLNIKKQQQQLRPWHPVPSLHGK